MRVTILFVGALLASLRVWIGLNVPPESFSLVDAYKDAAHLFVGGLFVAWRLQRQSWQRDLFWSLCVLEVAVAVASRQ